MPITHYDTLEVSPKASAEVIRAAYKSLMQRHHPDKQGAAAPSGDRATHIAQAYSVLSDPGQRAAYDQTLALPSLPLNGVAVPARANTKYSPPPDRKAWYVWYAWALIATILLAGGVILTQSKKRLDSKPALRNVQPGERQEGRTGSGPTATDPLSQSTASSGADMPAAQASAPLLARTLMPYALDLSVELATRRHVLTIPELGLRVGAPEPLRWVQKLEAQRQEILRQLLVRLAAVPFDELAKPEADLYLKSLMAHTVAQAIGLPPALLEPAVTPPVVSPADPTLVPVQPIEVLMPQGFRLR
ncbi:MAG: J domain-containing protein [Candidatus Saccharibacteria bacterium]|nr:J domain-containing protein [Rhodoferax sp.]